MEQKPDSSSKNDMVKRHILFWSIVALVVIIDQISKQAIKAWLPSGKNFIVIDHFFYIWHISNTGAGFSLFTGGNAILIWVSLIVIGIILFNYDKIIVNKWFAIAFALIIGGAVGNLTDRIVQGFVTDFLEFYLIFDYWPAFNAADAAVTIGAIIIIAYVLFRPCCCEGDNKGDNKAKEESSVKDEIPAKDESSTKEGPAKNEHDEGKTGRNANVKNVKSVENAKSAKKSVKKENVINLKNAK